MKDKRKKEKQEDGSSRSLVSAGYFKLKGGIKNALDKRAERLADEDVIFTEKLHPEPEEPPKPLVRGNVDMWFLLWSMLLLCFGAIMSYSASAVYAEQRYGDAGYLFGRYILFSAIAIVVTAIFVIFMRPWHWRLFGVLAYGAAIVLLVAVIFVGSAEGDAQRWIAIGPITIQPSEVAKVAVVMVLALYMSKYEKQITSTHVLGGSLKHGFIMPMVIIGFICGLIALESHISGLMIVGVLGVLVMFMGGTRIKWLALFLGLIAVAGVGLIFVSSYASTRVDIWLHIDEVDPLGAAWQTLQGLYAIGSGHLFGVGLGASRQKFGYVSQPQNDFIFTIICEELGFIGAFVLVALFALLIWRGIKIGQNAPDKFCALTVWGLTAKIAIQTAMNIAVVTNSMPNTGVSLPFFSSGGTALMIQIFEVGIILSISRFSTQKQ